MNRTEPDYERFMTFVDRSSGPDACHLWTGTLWQNRGYGRFYVERPGGVFAHRWLLGYLRGKPLELGEMGLHHCDNPPCVNPRHLYIGDQDRNMRDMVERSRSFSPAAEANKAKTHCKRGHPYTPDNTYYQASSRRRPGGKRVCRTCQCMWTAAYQERLRG